MVVEKIDIPIMVYAMAVVQCGGKVCVDMMGLSLRPTQDGAIAKCTVWLSDVHLCVQV